MDPTRNPIERQEGPPSHAPDSVITHDGTLLCLQCQAPLRAPKNPARPVKFCPGSRCRSAWHLDQRKQLISAIHDEIAGIRNRLDVLARSVEELK